MQGYENYNWRGYDRTSSRTTVQKPRTLKSL